MTHEETPDSPGPPFPDATAIYAKEKQKRNINQGQAVPGGGVTNLVETFQNDKGA